MYLTDIFHYLLTSILAIVYVSPTTTDDPLWKVTRAWQSSDENPLTLEAISFENAIACNKNQDYYLKLPLVLYGAQEIYQGNRLVYRWGYPAMNGANIVTSAPIIPCYQITSNDPITWKVYAYAYHFAQIVDFPKISDQKPRTKLFNEFFYVAGILSLISISVLLFLTLARRENNSLTYPLSLSALFLAGYLFGNCIDIFGIKISMFWAHKLADGSLSLGVVSLLYYLARIDVLSNRMWRLHTTSFVIGFPIIIFGPDGDVMQFGTSFQFLTSTLSLILIAYSVCRRLIKDRDFENLMLAIFSITFCVSFIYEMYLFSEHVDANSYVPLGMVFAMLALAIGASIRIRTTYFERDQLRILSEDLRKANELIKKSQASLLSKSKLETIGMLAAGVAHQLGNTLNTVSNGIFNIQRAQEMNLLTTERINSSIVNMKKAVSLSIEIIRGLDYASKQNFDKDYISIKDVVDTAIILMKGKILEKTKIVVNVDESHQAFALKNSLIQVFMNLISNSVDAMASKSDAKIEILSDLSEDFVKIAFSDNGPGIPANIASRIFEPFFTTKASEEGTGLGMYIVREELEKNNAKIKVLNSESGAMFLMEIPRKNSEKKDAT